MADVKVPTGAKQLTVEMTVIRADGTVEPYGVVAYWQRVADTTEVPIELVDLLIIT